MDITYNVYMYSLCSVVMGCAPGSVIPPLQNTHSNRRTTNGAMADDLVWIIIMNFGDHLLTRDHCRLIHIKQYLGRQGGRRTLDVWSCDKLFPHHFTSKVSLVSLIKKKFYKWYNWHTHTNKRSKTYYI